MSNAAFIIGRDSNLGIYVHWNGDRDSIDTFLEYAQLARITSLGPNNRGIEGFLTMLINFHGNDGSTVYLEDVKKYGGNPANSVRTFIIEDYQIVGAEPYERTSREKERHLEMLQYIDSVQPPSRRVGDALTGIPTPSVDLKIGDRVYLPRRYGDDHSKGLYRPYTVLGYRAPIHGRVNGVNVTGIPYVDRFDNQDNSENINSYVRDKIVRVVA